ncbi:isopenicillin N synthase family dioxygenase, partial [Actinophytocola sp.]|uniref:isopenicillin N synthase family dioxygenase n=1 Tax=Actinophytocola sp. TaxID=1872138 RepID=UPI002ED85894
MLPVVDISDPAAVAGEIERACRDTGFFYVTGHGVPAALRERLDAQSREFFALPLEEKLEIEMSRGGRAWRGYFPVGAELTAGEEDLKEGLYFGSEQPPSELPLHGPNLFPHQVPGLRDTVLSYVDALTLAGQDVLRGIAASLGLAADYFAAGYTASPTVLFRIFHYPPAPSGGAGWGVGEHTDYGLLTLLAQDDNGGLQVHTPGGWVDAPPLPDTFVCNIGDMLERLTAGWYRSTPHRVRNTSGRNRLSFPFFLDPDFSSEVPPLPDRAAVSSGGRRRWDGASPLAFT